MLLLPGYVSPDKTLPDWHHCLSVIARGSPDLPSNSSPTFIQIANLLCPIHLFFCLHFDHRRHVQTLLPAPHKWPTFFPLSVSSPQHPPFISHFRITISQFFTESSGKKEKSGRGKKSVHNQLILERVRKRTLSVWAAPGVVRIVARSVHRRGVNVIPLTGRELLSFPGRFVQTAEYITPLYLRFSSQRRPRTRRVAGYLLAKHDFLRFADRAASLPPVGQKNAALEIGGSAPAGYRIAPSFQGPEKDDATLLPHFQRSGSSRCLITSVISFCPLSDVHCLFSLNKKEKWPLTWFKWISNGFLKAGILKAGTSPRVFGSV